MKFLGLFPSAIYLSITLLIGLLLLFGSVLIQKDKESFKRPAWLALLSVSLLVLLSKNAFLPFLEQVNFSIPALLSLIWTTRLAEVELYGPESIRRRFEKKLPVLIALIVMTITNHVGDLYGLLSLDILFIMITTLRILKKKISNFSLVGDLVLLVGINLSYTLEQGKIVLFAGLIIFHISAFLESWKRNKVEA